MLKIINGRFCKNGKPFFYQADTCWSAFTNIELDDWRYYLNYRKKQGFNAIQINVLRQWDASGSELKLDPFPIKYNKDGSYNYDYKRLNIDYFDRAEKMLQEMQNLNMVPVLTLLWSNYVPDTWASKVALNSVFPYENLDEYVTYVVSRFKKYSPIYFISGDTDFPTNRSVQYYRKVFDIAKSIDTDALYSFHIKGRYTEIPSEFKENEDFFCYQSGHNYEGQNTAYEIPLNERKDGFTKPIINSEPCYDQISYSRNEYGRYTARDVRQASWSSILSGADAGVSYGAHGIWSWHKTGFPFGIVEGEGFATPFDWHDALNFRGADDIHLLKNIMTSEFPEGCKPIEEGFKYPQIRGAYKENKYIIYVPYNIEIDLNFLDLNNTNSTIECFDLEKKCIYEALWHSNKKGIVQLTPCTADELLIIHRNGGN